MRVLVVHSGHGFSTLNVGEGVVAGLRANGIETWEYPLHRTFEMAELLVGAARLMEISEEYPDPIDLGTMGIPGFAMAKQVEWVVFIHGLKVPASIPVTLRRGGYRTALYCTESPYQIEQEQNIAQFYDVVFTSEKNALPLFTLNRPDTVHYLPHAWIPGRHTPQGDRAEECDVFFCGTRYPERDVLLQGVDWTGINVVDKSLDYTKEKNTAKLLMQIVENNEVAAYYRSAHISINHHRQVTDFNSQSTITPGSAVSLNPRAYEVPACGGFLISDEREELREVFGDSVPTYGDGESLSRLIRYYLAHKEERDILAMRQYDAVRPHSWTNRARTLIDILAKAQGVLPLAA